MKNEILQRLDAVLGALNRVTVCGKENLGNLSGSIVMLEEIGRMLQSVAFAEVPKSEVKE